MRARPSLQDRILASTFVEYLEAYGFKFTQSVFFPESQLDSWPPFSRDEVVQILRLDLAPFWITKEVSGERSCLAQQLIAIVQHFLSSASTRDSSTQTEEIGPKKLDAWLKEIDDAFKKKLEKEQEISSSRTAEERVTKLHRDFDKQVRAEVDAQVKRIREVEVAQARMDEAASYRRQLASARKDLDDMQRTLREQLAQQEATLEERFQAKQREVEFLAYQQRQRALETTEDIRTRTDKLKLDTEVQERGWQRREEALQAREMQVKIREEDANHLKEFLHSQAEEVLAMRKNQLEKEYQSLREKLLMERSTLEAEKNQLNEERRAITSSRNDKELIQALYRRLSAEEAQRKSLLVRINELTAAGSPV
ncbi:apical junction molecule-like [Selaginella moellendorffii]|uniref:apical junction molecule-like n=1 Tax=Selaginella moellendorffii TaxID=88036 RepID=UPI000D1CE404|nr:apical junction molecule-like [Selaginella moellendorffii]|eukprot:XP_024527942.1 apical junction molecule-like [Selaginella moellendorffii]